MKAMVVATFLFLVSGAASAQNFIRQEPFHLVNTGSGAAAMGMSGAYTAVADDLSAFAWNPAGLSSRSGFSGQIDAMYTSASENFEVTTYNSGTSQHNFNASRFQPQSLALSYQMERGVIVFGPSFAWSRASLFLSDYTMEEPAKGHYINAFPLIDADYTSTANYAYDRSGEDLYSFGFSLKKERQFAVGFTISVLGGQVTRTATWDHTNDGKILTFPPDSDPQLVEYRSVWHAENITREEYSGHFVLIGVLVHPGQKFSFGATFRNGYKRKADRTGTSALHSESTLGTYDYSSSIDPESIEYSVPAEFSAGIGIRFSDRILFGSSFTFADYSSDDLYSNTYPTLRQGGSYQSALVQWRNGVAFHATPSVTVRGGWILDNQPYTLKYYPLNESNDSIFNGFTIGAGWRGHHVSLDAAYLHEAGKALFGERLGGITDHDVEFDEGRFTHHRLFLSIAFHG